MLRFRMLGPLEVDADGTALNLGPTKQRQLLARLVLARNHAVSIGDLVAELWWADPPASSVDNLRLYASRLRRVLDAAAGRPVLHRAGPGYRLVTEPGEVDIDEFTAGVQRGRASAAGDLHAAAGELTSALGLWHGRLVEDVPHSDYVAACAVELDEARGAATEDLATAHIHLAALPAATRVLAGLVKAEPLRERAQRLLVLCHYVGGDTVAALRVYQSARAALADSLGIDPSREFQQLHRSILRNDDPAELIDRYAPVPAEPGRPAPAGSANDTPGKGPGSAVRPDSRHPSTAINTMPHRLPGFVGRQAELRHLTRELARADPPAIAVIAGQGGIGKTALGLNWAYENADRYPDGQLFVNLHGYGGRPLAVAEGLTQLFVALGVSPMAIPPDIDAASALYRSMLAGRRMLIMIDNVASAESVRPLLPGAGCATVVTSRDRLAGLVATDGAAIIELPRLSREHSIEILRRIVGEQRIAGESRAADGLSAICGDLPLALRVAAANLSGRSGTSVTDYCAEIRAGNVLDALQVDGDPGAGVRATIAGSYARLSRGGQRLFRRLGTTSGPHVTVAAGGVLCDLPRPAVARQFREVVQAHLLHGLGEGRYVMHDLVRAYAVELGAADPDSGAAWHRLLGYLVAQTDHAVEIAYGSPPGTAEPPPDGIAVDRFATPAEATAWLDTEHPNLVSELTAATDRGPAPLAARLMDGLAAYFWSCRNSAPWQAALDAATRTLPHLDRPAAARLHSHQGKWHRAHGRYLESAAAFETAHQLFAHDGDWRGEADAWTSLGSVALESGDAERGRDCYARAIEIRHAHGDAAGARVALTGLSYISGNLNDFPAALRYALEAVRLCRAPGTPPEHLGAALLAAVQAYFNEPAEAPAARALCDEAVTVFAGVGNIGGEATAWVAASTSARRRGLFAEAEANAERALELARRTNSPNVEGFALLRRGDARQARGDAAAAGEDYQAARRLAHDHGIRDIEATALAELASIRLGAGMDDEAVTLARECLKMATHQATVSLARDVLDRAGT